MAYGGAIPSKLTAMSYQQPNAGVGAGYQPQQAPQGQPQQAQQTQQQPGWYADPFGRHEARWWDGTQWTEHVSSHGRQTTDAPQGGSYVPTDSQKDAQRAVQNVQEVAAGAAFQGGGTLFTEPVLVVSQKAKIFEVNQEFQIYNQHGQQVGAVRQVGQSAAKKVLRFVGNYDQFMTHKFQLVDAYGNVQLSLTRPRKVLKSRMIVQDPAGNEIGQISQQNMMGKIRFNLESGGHVWGSINGENWRAWNFNLQDHGGNEIARITKKWAGLKSAFTTADNYVVQIHRQLDEPLRSLVVAAAVTVDTAIHQFEA